MTNRLLALAATLLLAGCASVDSEQAIGTARDWSQRIDADAPQLRTSDPQDKALRALRRRLLASPLDETSAVQLSLAQTWIREPRGARRLL